MATIQGVYVALFGRPADPAGLAYFNGVTNNGANLSAIGNLAGQAEYTARFTGLNNTAIVNSIYQSLFGRDAEAAGLTFFVDALNKGTLSINNIAIAILDGAQGTDKTIVANKVAAADLFTKSVDTAIEIGSYTGNSAAAIARTFISGVTTTPATQAQADASVLAVVVNGGAGATIALPAATDVTLSLTSGVLDGTVTKFTTERNDTINAGATWTAADKIDGGLGTDTFNAEVAAATVVAVDGLKNVEVLNFTSTNNAAAVNLAEAKQATQVWSVANTVATDFAATNVALTATVGLKGNLAATAQTFAFADATGSADTAALALDGVTSTGVVTLAAVETLNVSNLGTSSITGLVTAAAKAINVSGSGDLTIGATAAALETVSASAFTGKITADFTANDALKSYVGGTGSDKITIDGVHTNDLTINTGAGADTIIVSGAGAETKALTLTGGADADIFQFANNVGNVQAVDTNANFIKTLITITDFDKSVDAIKVLSGAATRDTILTAEQAEITAASDLLAAAKIAAGYTTLTNTSIFTYGADSYILQNTGGQALDTGDTLIKVTGVTSVADFTASNFALVV